MIAAIYARKSNEQNGVADESKSVTRQISMLAPTRRRRAGSPLTSTDDGISGALFGDQSPGLARLLNALRPRSAFNALIISEESRLGREQVEPAYVLKQIIEAGVRVFLYKPGNSDDRPIGRLARAAVIDMASLNCRISGHR